MDDSSTAALDAIGHDLIQSFVSVTVETFIVAIYSVLVLKASWLLLRKKNTSSRASLCTFLAVFVMYTLALALWIIDVHSVVTEARSILLSNSTDPIEERLSSARSHILHLTTAEVLLYNYMTIIGDAIIIWRVFAFWSSPKERFVLLVPLAFLLGSLTTSSLLTYCSTRPQIDIALGTYQHPAFCRNIQTASYSTALATTAVATILVSYKTWKYRATYRSLAELSVTSTGSQTLRVMSILIESGILYMLFFLVWLVASIEPINVKIVRHTAMSFAWNIFEDISSLIVGIYPTLIVIIVHSNRSILKSQSQIFTHTMPPPRTNRRTHDGASYRSDSTTEIAGPAHPTELHLYEMARMSTNGDMKKVGDV